MPTLQEHATRTGHWRLCGPMRGARAAFLPAGAARTALVVLCSLALCAGATPCAAAKGAAPAQPEAAASAGSGAAPS